MKKRIIKIFAFAVLLVLCFSSLPISVFARSVVPDDIHTTNVVDDLLKMEAYSKDKFDIDAEADYCDIIDLIEWGFDASGKTSDYSLFLYIYNPSCKSIDTSSYKNKIQLRHAPVSETIAGGDTPWEKFSLIFVNKSDNDLFYKFKIDVPQSYMREVDKTRRIYQIADVEFKFADEAKARSSGASGEWIYTGYQEYHADGGNNTYSTLWWDSKNLLTVDFDIRSASWKTATSDKGQGYQYEISSVYFAVPDTIIEEYGNPKDVYKGLREVEYTMENYKISGVSTTDKEFYNTLKQYVGVDCNTTDVPFGFKTEVIGLSGLTEKVEFAFNKANFSQLVTHPANFELSTYGNAFYNVVGQGSENFAQVMYNLRSNGGFYGSPGSIGSGKNHVSTDDGDLAEQLATRSVEQGRWDFWDAIKGIPYYESENSYTGIDPIVAVDEDYIYKYKDSACGDKYFISNEDSTDFCNYVKSNANKNTTFIMRFAVTDYYCSDTYMANDGSLWFNDVDHKGINYYMEKEIFLDFDILTLTWERANGSRTVLPVKSSPIDIYGDPSYPSGSNPDSGNVNTDGSQGNGNENGCAEIMDLRTSVLVFGALLIVAVLCFFPGLLRLIGKIFGVLLLPLKWLFRGIGYLFDNIFVPDHAKRTEHKLKMKEGKQKENKEKNNENKGE